ncbi:MAG TPA: CHASE sensor domain-containing protein [Rhodocyclaceae bacterium]|nr:CHASE sensor domain-containing protein [Rhodocyclaceae bacterium]
MPRTVHKSYWRLSVLTAAIALLATFVLVLGLNWYTARTDLLEDLDMQARVVGANSAAALAFGDGEAAAETLSAFRQAPIIVGATLYLKDGRVLARFRHNNAPESDPVKSPGLLRVEVPISLEERPLGRLVLWATLEPIYDHQLRFLIGFILIVFFAGSIAYMAGRGIRDRLAANQEELEQSRTLLRQLTAYRETVVEAEHKRIAREIHDELGQVLTTALLHLNRMDRQAHTGASVSTEQIQEIRSLIDDAIRGVKGIASELRPAVLNIGLGAAIEWLVERALGKSGIKCGVDIPDELPQLDDRAATTLFRIVQESITNVIRHAQARSLNISLYLEPDHICLEVRDDGVGLKPVPKDGQPHFGLVGIQERAASIGGHAEITGAPGRGTCVRVSLPYSNRIGK